MPTFVGQSQAIQDALQGACCFDLCQPITEMEDNQFLATVLWGLIGITGVALDELTDEQIQTASNNAWCELNMATLCSIPPDKLKALILTYISL